MTDPIFTQLLQQKKLTKITTYINQFMSEDDSQNETVSNLFIQLYNNGDNDLVTQVLSRLTIKKVVAYTNLFNYIINTNHLDDAGVDGVVCILAQVLSSVKNNVIDQQIFNNVLSINNNVISTRLVNCMISRNTSDKVSIDTKNIEKQVLKDNVSFIATLDDELVTRIKKLK